MENRRKKYWRVCNLVGNMRQGGLRKKDLYSLTSELSGGDRSLDNLLYENLGLSGEDLVRLLQKGERMV